MIKPGKLNHQNPTKTFFTTKITKRTKNGEKQRCLSNELNPIFVFGFLGEPFDLTQGLSLVERLGALGGEYSAVRP